jgi:hypothetical protein
MYTQATQAQNHTAAAQVHAQQVHAPSTTNSTHALHQQQSQQHRASPVMVAQQQVKASAIGANTAQPSAHAHSNMYNNPVHNPAQQLHMQPSQYTTPVATLHSTANHVQTMMPTQASIQTQPQMHMQSTMHSQGHVGIQPTSQAALHQPMAQSMQSTFGSHPNMPSAGVNVGMGQQNMRGAGVGVGVGTGAVGVAGMPLNRNAPVRQMQYNANANPAPYVQQITIPGNSDKIISTCVRLFTCCACVVC